MSKSVIYGGPSTAVEAPDGTVFPAGVPVPVSDELAEALLRQGFSPAPTALSGPAEAPAIQAPSPVVSHVPTADPEPDAVAPVVSGAAILAPSTGV